MILRNYKIILMDFDGKILCEYESYIVPSVNDTILIDDDESFIVHARHFSTNHIKAVLLGEIDKGEIEEIKNN